MTMPAIAPPESESSRDGTTIGVEVTVCVTTSPEMVTTRVLVIGDGVADSGMTDELEDVVGSGVENVDDVDDVDDGVEEVDVVLGTDDDCWRRWSA
jgi:hypothetical protein